MIVAHQLGSRLTISGIRERWVKLLPSGLRESASALFSLLHGFAVQ
jgi:hypothetical protein